MTTSKPMKPPVAPPPEELITTLYLRSVPKTVKRRFKSWCASNGITMTDKLVELMRTTVEI